VNGDRRKLTNRVKVQKSELILVSNTDNEWIAAGVCAPYREDEEWARPDVPKIVSSSFIAS